MGSILVGSARVAIVPDMMAFGADLKAKFDAEVRALNLQIPIRFDADQASLAAVLAQAQALGDTGVTIPVRTQLDKPSLAASDLALKSWLATQQANIKVGADVDAASVAAAREAEAAVGEEAAKTAGEVSAAGEAEKFAADQAAGPAAADAVLAGTSRALTDAIGAETKALAINAAARTVLGDISLAAVYDQAIAGGGGGGGGGTPAAAAAGGAFGRGGGRLFNWRAQIAGVGALHVALDLAAESLISVGLASAAAAAGVAAAAPAVNELSDDLHSVWAASSALHQNIPPLTSEFSSFAKSMAPQVIEAYGGALDLLTHNSGALERTGGEVVTMFDDWVIKIDEWSRAQGGVGNLLQSGVGYLSQFGSIIGKVGEDLDQLLRADPGIARYLLDIVQAGADLLGLVLRLPGPLIEVALGLHGIWLWGNVLVAAPLLRYARALGILSDEQVASAKSGLRFASVLKFLAFNPYGWALDAAAALAILAWRGSQADTATKRLIADMNTQLLTENASQAILQITSDIGRLSTAMAGTHPQDFARGWDNIGNTITRVQYTVGSASAELAKAFSVKGFSADSFGSFFGDLGKSINDFVTGSGAMQQRATVNIGALNGELNKLVGNQRNLFSETGRLMGQGDSYTQSLALMDMAGVKAGDSLQTMSMKVALMIRGYQNMGQTGGMLTNTVNAVTFALWQQDSDVAKVNQGWDAFFSTVSGGASGFVSYAQSLDTLGKATTTSKASIDGLDASSLTLRQDFLSTAGAASTEMDNLTSLVSVAGLGAKGTRMLAQATRDMLTTMLPAAKGSEQMTTVLYTLAQRGGYRGADSFKALTTWVGNVKDPMRNLDGVVTVLTKDTGNLSTDVQHLANALSVTLSNAMATAILVAHGGTGAFDAFAKDVVHLGVGSKTTQQAADNLGAELVGVTHNASDAKTEFVSFATAGLDVTRANAEQLWDEFRQQQLDSTAVKAANTKKQFESLASMMGVNTTQAGKLWSALHKLPTSEKLKVLLTGTGTYSLSGSGFPTKSGKTPTGLGGAELAAGGYIGAGTTSTADDVLARVSRGEVVVPARMVSAGAVDHLRGRIPGFAAGGFVPAYGPGTTSGLGAWATANYQASVGQMAAALAGSIASASAASAFGIPGAAAAGTGNAQAIAKRLLASMGWSAQWPALDMLWDRESGWRWNADNPGSGAYGIPQSLPADKMAAAGADWRTNPATQIRWGLGYIGATYGDPDNAWAHELSHGWYDQGGVLPPGLTLAANLTGQPELVLTPGQLAALGGSAGSTYHAHFDGLTGQAIEGHVRTAFTAMQIAEAHHLRIGRPQ